ncbi:hypothetical protein [uncultured Thiothrix sp.]|uniref:hypothetical protein n=1 Tax=uncultured Thiothrix sp. TaxID=223185 RepID=UPI00261327F6|nr:hypothetical protein [uncultured Thiothrix sp.]
MSENTYSVGLSILFWLLWIVGLLILLLFGFFTLATASDVNVMATWNGLVVVVEGFLLLKTGLHFARKDIPMSKLLLWIVVAVVAVPFIAFGGCFILNNMNLGLNFGH